VKNVQLSLMSRFLAGSSLFEWFKVSSHSKGLLNMLRSRARFDLFLFLVAIQTSGYLILAA
jgi:hypothetical protein